MAEKRKVKQEDEEPSDGTSISATLIKRQRNEPNSLKTALTMSIAATPNVPEDIHKLYNMLPEKGVEFLFGSYFIHTLQVPAAKVAIEYSITKEGAKCNFSTAKRYSCKECERAGYPSLRHILCGCDM